MTVNIHVNRGLEFKRDIYNTRDRAPWLAAVGKELETKGLSVKLGDGANAVTIKTGAELVAFYEQYKSDPDGMALKVGMPKGRELSEYMSDLVSALDDIVKDTSRITSGDTVDLSKQSEVAKVLGLSVSSTRYASSRTDFDKMSRPEGSMSVLGVRMSRDPIKKNPLDGKKFIDSTTFQGTRIQTGRDSEEIEAVRHITGLDKSQVIELARSERGGRSALARMRKPTDSEAFSLGYSGIGFDNMRWDSDAHRVREMNPYVSLTVESGRMEKDEASGEYEVSQGTDFFQDTYYKGVNPNKPGEDTLLDNDVMVRARVRMGSAGEPSRILLQAKLGTTVDENGMKSAAKVDIRDDSPTAAEVAGLDDAIRTGKATAGFNGTPTNPVSVSAVNAVYQDLGDRGVLPDVGDHKGVLMMEPGAYILSERARYHLNETSPAQIKGLLEQGPKWVGEVKTIVESSGISAADKASLVAMADGILNKSSIAERAKADILAANPTLTEADITPAFVESFWPRQIGWNAGAKKEDVAVRKAVADALKASYDEFSEAFDGARRNIAGARDANARPMDDTAELFAAFAKEKVPAMVTTTTVGPFIKYLDDQLAGPNKDAFITELSTWMAGKGENALQNAGDKGDAIAGMRKNLVNEHLDILHRQVEASGTAGKALWFDEARTAFASADRTTWNFLIDTYDFITCVSPKDWETLTPEQRDGRSPIPADKIYHADISADVQIELGFEKDYITAIRTADDAVLGASAGVFMDFALTQSSSGTTAADGASFATFRDAIGAMSDADKTSTLQALNKFAADKGSPLTFTAETLVHLKPETFTTDRQNKPVDGHAQLLSDSSMTKMIWKTLTNAQESICDLRGNRTKREAERAGFNDVGWAPTDMSKGEAALTLLRG